MKAVKVEPKNAEKAKFLLKEKNALVTGVPAFNENGFVFFPVTRKISLPFKSVFTQRKFKEVQRSGELKELLSSVLSKTELSDLVKSFDVIGSICIIEVHDSLLKKKKLIAKKILEANKHVKTVLMKKSAMLGEYRVRDLEWLAGEKTTLALYKEAGAVMRVDLSKVYFSVRLAFERMRIAKKIRPGEKILALFAGVGPFPLVFFKKQKNVEIIAVELNPIAVSLMRENVVLNKAEHAIKVVQGDVNKIVPKLKNLADRIVMPLPHTGFDFLDSALIAAKKNCVIHFYCFNSIEENKKKPFNEALVFVRTACKKRKRKYRVLNKRIVRPYSPKQSQVVIDFKVF
ncbi:MAG: class I SAM-dependent methyltransferase family protein [Candidatus Micrarchaeota archaeon]